MIQFHYTFSFYKLLGSRGFQYLVKDQSSFYEIRSLAIYINIKAFDWVNKKQVNIL